jgi:2-oxoglutarate ferredoxin oxidoreductase subunit beta
MSVTNQDWELDTPRYFSMEDFEGGVARWCPGCGDHGVLTAVQRICRDKKLLPEEIVAVSGIGCSSRLPH